MKSQIIKIIAVASAAVIAGVGIAYYNTKSMGYSDDVAFVTVGEESITIMDYEIEYRKIKSEFNKVKKYVPKSAIWV